MAALGFLDELDLAISAVAQSPERYPEYLDGTRRFVFPRYPFYLVYVQRADEVVIIAVSHQRRGPRYWVERGE